MTESNIYKILIQSSRGSSVSKFDFNITVLNTYKGYIKCKF